MKKVIAIIFCCTIICASDANNNTLNNITSATEITSSESMIKIPDYSTSSKPSTNIKTSTVINNVDRTTTEVPKAKNNIISIPVFDSKPYKWVLNGTNSSIILQMTAKLIIGYHNSTSKQNVSMEIDVPGNNNTKMDGNFTQYDETLMLSWNSTGDQQNYVLFHFKRFMNSYVLNNLRVSINVKDDAPHNSTSTFNFVHSKEHFNTSVGNSYRCIRLQTFNLTQANNNTVVGFMKVTDLQFQAFKTDKNTGFGLAEDCAFDTPDVVPIAVGCVLAGLVIIVLAAYLISRRRSEARGYLSM